MGGAGSSRDALGNPGECGRAHEYVSQSSVGVCITAAQAARIAANKTAAVKRRARKAAESRGQAKRPELDLGMDEPDPEDEACWAFDLEAAAGPSTAALAVERRAPRPATPAELKMQRLLERVRSKEKGTANRAGP